MRRHVDWLIHRLEDCRRGNAVLVALLSLVHPHARQCLTRHLLAMLRIASLSLSTSSSTLAALGTLPRAGSSLIHGVPAHTHTILLLHLPPLSLSQSCDLLCKYHVKRKRVGFSTYTHLSCLSTPSHVHTSLFGWSDTPFIRLPSFSSMK